MESNDKSTISRRDFLRMAALMGAGLAVASCGPAGQSAVTPTPSLQGMKINYLGWEGYDNADALKGLTEPNSITVNSTYGGNNEEIFSKLKAGSAGQYDVISIYHGNVPSLIDNDMVISLDTSRLVNYADIFDVFKTVSFNKKNGHLYSYPFTFGNTPLVYNPEFVPNGVQSWNDLKKPEYKGKVVQLDNWADLMIGIAVLGGDLSQPITKDQLAESLKWLLDLKPQIRAIVPSYGEMADMMARKEAWLTTGAWVAIIGQAQAKGVTLVSVIPKEGTFGWCDNYLIPKGANETAGYAFINQMTSPKGAAILAQALDQTMTNKKVVPLLPKNMQGDYANLDADLKKTPFPPDPPVNPTDPNIASFSDITSAWETYKTA